MKDNYEFEEPHLATKQAEMEGKVYAHLWINKFGNTFFMHTDYYTVCNGFVFRIGHEGDLDKTKDTLFNVERDCFYVGNYAGSDFKSFYKEVTVKQALRKFK